MLRYLCLVVALAFVAPIQAQKKEADPKKDQKPAVPLDLSYRTRVGMALTYDGDITVKSGYGHFQLIYTLEVRTLKASKDGGQQIAITVKRWKEMQKYGKETTLNFDSLKPADKTEDSEWAALRKIINKTLCVANVAATGEMSRLIFSEEGDELWKKEGSETFSRARDLLKLVLPIMPGKVVAVGETWTEERKPAGEQLQFAFKMTHKVSQYDAEKGLATFELAAKPEKGASDMVITKAEMKETTGVGVFDCQAGRLVNWTIKGSCRSRTGEGPIAEETEYDFDCRVTVRE